MTEDSTWKMAFQPPPTYSTPRIPKREELLLTRLTVGLVPSVCRPLSTSRSRLRVPYSLKLENCACAGAIARTLATARISSVMPRRIEHLRGEKTPRTRRQFPHAAGIETFMKCTAAQSGPERVGTRTDTR